MGFSSVICIQQKGFTSEVMRAFDADDCVFWLRPLKCPGKTNEGCPRPPIKFSGKTLESTSKHGKQKVGQRSSIEKDALNVGETAPLRSLTLCWRPVLRPAHPSPLDEASVWTCVPCRAVMCDLGQALLQRCCGAR